MEDEPLQACRKEDESDLHLELGDIVKSTRVRGTQEEQESTFSRGSLHSPK